MTLPVEVVFRDLVPLPSLEGEIRRRADKLKQFVPELMSCHVAVEATGSQHRQGHRYFVKIDVRVPGEEIYVGDHHGDEDVAIAMRGAFDAMARRLEDHARRRRGQAKHHESQGTAAGSAEGQTPSEDSAA
jgi:ribosome-associated translation inhibitor RaiA